MVCTYRWTDCFRGEQNTHSGNGSHFLHNRTDCYDSMFQKNSPQKKKQMFSQKKGCFRYYKVTNIWK